MGLNRFLYIINNMNSTTKSTPKVKLSFAVGYEPFGEYKGNPSARIAQKLNDAVLPEGIRVVGVVLRNTYDSHDILHETVKKERKRKGMSNEEPVVIVSGGLSSSIHKVSLELVGFNEINSKYADANGVLVNDGRPIVKDAPPAYRTNADLTAVSLELGLADIPTILSTDPGRFTCNSIDFGMKHLLAVTAEPTLFMFYHTGVHKGDITGELPPSKIYHNPEWLEKGVPIMIATLARQAETMLANKEWALPNPMSLPSVPTMYYTK